MRDVRCECGKILCKIAEKQIIIKCRHCKRYLEITVKFLGESQGKYKVE